jgi:cytochrome c-type protein NapC
MADDQTTPPTTSRTRRLWRWAFGLATGTAGIAFVFGILFWGGFNTAMEATNREEFCISCHEMKDNVYAEYHGTIHDTNRTGVRAICPDCHVPRQVGPLMKRKFAATFELYGHFISGVINTKEKFEARRHELATHVWTRMKETDSLECRNCHKSEKMSSELQSPKAQARHAKAKAENLTCIDCHYGIAHKEPEGPGPRELKVGNSK